MLSLKNIEPEKAFDIARRMQADGKLDEARKIYEQLLHQMPRHPQSLTMLGSIAYQQGDDLQGEAFIDRAIEVYRELLPHAPHDPGLRGSMMNLLMTRQHTGEAEALAADLMLPINPVRATRAQFESARGAAIAKDIPLILINTVPKSASESIWNRLAEGLGTAQGHLSLCLYPDCCLLPARVTEGLRGGLIAKEHIPATRHNLDVMAQQGLKRMVFHVRDPRQVTLSWAHFVRDDISMRLMGPLWRKIVPPAAVLQQEFSGLLDWCIDHFLPGTLEFMAGWMALEQKSDAPLEIQFMSFERFLDDPRGYLDEVLDFAGVDRALFRDKDDAEVVHLRKGQKDEWRQVLSKAQQDRAWRQIPSDMAEAFGWQA